MLEVDPVIERFAAQYDLRVHRNRKDWPERSLVWGDDVRCLLQLYLASKETLAFNLWLCASQDRDGRRYWKQEMLIKARPMAEFRDRLPDLLGEGHRRLVIWSANPALLESVTGMR